LYLQREQRGNDRRFQNDCSPFDFDMSFEYITRLFFNFSDIWKTRVIFLLNVLHYVRYISSIWLKERNVLLIMKREQSQILLFLGLACLACNQWLSLSISVIPTGSHSFTS